jgi:hypothetical protein
MGRDVKGWIRFEGEAAAAELLASDGCLVVVVVVHKGFEVIKRQVHLLTFKCEPRQGN